MLIAEVEVEQWIREVRLKVDVDGARALEVALGMAAVDMFVQLPCLLGRQFTHGLLAFTQAQLLHTPALLHLQHRTVSRRRTHPSILSPIPTTGIGFKALRGGHKNALGSI